MNVIEKNVGPKIDYEVRGQKITFDDDLTINLAKRQKDDPEHIDVCFDRDGELVIGAAAGRAYVAEIDIPAREYEYHEDTEGDEETEPPTPLPLDMDKVTLTLWAVE
jgi:hypothetical protein